MKAAPTADGGTAITARVETHGAFTLASIEYGSKAGEYTSWAHDIGDNEIQSIPGTTAERTFTFTLPFDEFYFRIVAGFSQWTYGPGYLAGAPKVTDFDVTFDANGYPIVRSHVAANASPATVKVSYGDVANAYYASSTLTPVPAGATETRSHSLGLKRSMHYRFTATNAFGKTEGSDRTTTPTVRYVYAYPTDRTPNPTYQAAIANSMLKARRWYLDQVGQTFKLASSIAICELPNASDYYRYGGWGKVAAELPGCLADKGWNTTDDWIVYADATNGCSEDVPGAGQGFGAGLTGLAIMGDHDLRGLSGDLAVPKACAGVETRGYDNWLGGTIHEMAHSFGLLDHTYDRYGCGAYPWPAGSRCALAGGSVLGYGFPDFPNTYFVEEEKQDLRESRWFGG